MNHVDLIGRAAIEPKLVTTPSGTEVTNFILAVERDYVAQDKEKVTDFLPVLAWRSTARFICEHVHKGQRIGVSGIVQSRTYKDRAGQPRRAVEIVAQHVDFADSRPAASTDSEEKGKENIPEKAEGEPKDVTAYDEEVPIAYEELDFML